MQEGVFIYRDCLSYPDIDGNSVTSPNNPSISQPHYPEFHPENNTVVITSE